MKWLTRMLLGSAVLLVATGCSNAAQTADSSLGAGGMSAEQRGALSDSQVTYDEYQSAFRRFAACVEGAGSSVEKLGETNQVIDYRIPESAASGVSSRCYDREFRQVDARWQVSREDTSVQAARFRACLVKAGIEPKPTEREMFDQLVAAGIDTVGCAGG